MLPSLPFRFQLFFLVAVAWRYNSASSLWFLQLEKERISDVRHLLRGPPLPSNPRLVGIGRWSVSEYARVQGDSGHVIFLF